jgi:predicted esterase
MQPYGLVIPEKLDLSKPVPLYVWLHGRGDKTTDLQFIHQRQTSVGQIAPDNAIVLHPFGRYCNAFKFAGETDVLEAIDSVAERYPIDRRRIVLWGFSMGGAGAWHLGAHYPDRWVVVSPGAGFAETARYQRLDPAIVPEIERTLWSLYDVPCYARNLLNVPVIAYSGEMDKQIQAARVMEEALAEHGLQLKHLIGPGMGHKYHPDTLKELAALVDAEVTKGQDPHPREIHLQTRTLRYGHSDWLTIQGLEEHWQEARVDARVVGHEKIQIDTKNVTSLHIESPWRSGSGFTDARSLVIDGQTKPLDWNLYRSGFSLLRHPETGDWALRQDGSPLAAATSQMPLAMQTIEERQPGSPYAAASPPVAWGSRLGAPTKTLSKIPGLQGPIDDVFYEPFLVVLPSGKSSHEQVEKWVAAESEHLKDRWRRLFRGELRIKQDFEVTDADLKTYHVVCWGDRSSNRLIAKVVDSLPIRWTSDAVTVGKESYPSTGHVLAAIYPNPESPSKYVVLNSGMTFRAQHDRTNSQQNPKLPDWAVIDLSQPPDGKAPGKIASAGFFDEAWHLKP